MAGGGQPDTARRRLLASGLALGALGGCSLASQWDGKTPFTTATGFTLYPTPEWMFQNWDHPDSMARWETSLSLNRTMGNDWKDGLAISAGGKYVASPVGASPLNAITIFEVDTGKRWRLAHPNSRVEIIHPVFSPDGESIAMIASPPTYGGDCEIWIAPVRGGHARVIRPAVPRNLRWPVFSWDGTRIACFRDILGRPPSRVKPEYQSDEFGALVEYDIATGAETKVSDLILSTIAPHAAYAPNGSDFLVGARIFGGPLGLRNRVEGKSEPAPVDCGTSGCFPDHGPVQPPPGLIEGRQLFEVRRGAPALRFPVAARPAVFGAPGSRLGDTSTFYGADRQGRVVISDYRRAHVCDEAGIMKSLDLAAWAGDPGYPNIQMCALSADGAAIAVATPLGFVDEGNRIDVLRDGVHRTFLLKPADDGPANTSFVKADAGASRFPG